MKTEREVESRFRELYTRRLKERKAKYLARDYLSCRWNKRHRVKRSGMVGFCENPTVVERSKHAVVVCTDKASACKCKHYDCRNTEASVEADFESVVRDPSRCGQQYPKLAMLIWFLRDHDGLTRRERFTSAFGLLGRAVWSVLTFRWW